MRNPEWSAANNIDKKRRSHEELSPLMKRAHEKAVREVLTNPDVTIKEEEFKDVYEPAAIAGDIKRADQIERNNLQRETEKKANAYKVSQVFESIIVTQSETSNWLANARTLKTSRYDDFVNKVDMLAEWKGAHLGSILLALGVDVTYGEHVIEKKIFEIKRQIDEGKLATVKYFKDEENNFKGRRNNIPRVVIGVSETVVTELAQLWVNGERKALKEHPIQHLIIKEIDFQLRHMRAYAIRAERSGLVSAYNQAIAVIERVKSTKQGLMLGELQNDPVWKSIVDSTKGNFAA